MDWVTFCSCSVDVDILYDKFVGFCIISLHTKCTYQKAFAEEYPRSLIFSKYRVDRLYYSIFSLRGARYFKLFRIIKRALATHRKAKKKRVTRYRKKSETHTIQVFILLLQLIRN